MSELVLWQLDAIDLGPISAREGEIEYVGILHALAI